MFPLWAALKNVKLGREVSDNVIDSAYPESRARIGTAVVLPKGRKSFSIPQGTAATAPMDLFGFRPPLFFNGMSDQTGGAHTLRFQYVGLSALRRWKKGDCKKFYGS